MLLAFMYVFENTVFIVMCSNVGEVSNLRVKWISIQLVLKRWQGFLKRHLLFTAPVYTKCIPDPSLLFIYLIISYNFLFVKT